MATQLKQWVMAIGILCLLQPAFAATPDLNKAIAAKTAQLEKSQKKTQDITKQIETLEKEKKQIEIDITRFSLDVKRLSLNTTPDEATKTALAKAQFEKKRAEFNLAKNTSQLERLYKRLEETREQKRIYQAQIDQMREDQKKSGLASRESAEVEKQRRALEARLGMTTPAKTAETSKPASAAADRERARLAELEKQKQLQAQKAREADAARERARVAELEKQKQLEAQKAKELAAAQQRAHLAELEKQKQLEAQKNKELAAAQERARLAELEKQKQLDAQKAKELAAAQERTRLAELEKQQQLEAQKAQELAAETARAEQAEREKAALAARQAEENARQTRELEEQARQQQQQLEQQRLQAMAAASSAAPAALPNSGLNAAVDAKGKPKKTLTPQQKTQQKFIRQSTILPPPESALTLAMARSLDASAELPVLGNNPNLEVANPVGSNPRTVGAMKYLGNNQYMLELRVQKGKQVFLLGEHSFVKNIPEHFDGIRCLLLVDARNKNNPTFQLVVAGG